MPAKEKAKNIQIPLETFKNMIRFMECCDIRDCTPELQQLYRSIFSVLIAKQESMDLRDAYAKVVFAEDESQRKDARAAYLEQKEIGGL
jgi:hypothetical protein